MNRQNRPILLAIAGIFLPVALAAQEIAPLVRERQPNVSVTVTTKEAKQADIQKVATPTPIPTPTPDPSKVIVAIVNDHFITKEQMDRRVAALMGRRDDRITAEDLLGPAALKPQSLKNPVVDELANNPAIKLEQRLMDEQQLLETEEAIRRAEEQMIYEWVEQMTLADEARRQGFLISDQELQDRLRQLDREFELSGNRVESLLSVFGMTREELESYVYDALLIEKLLQRYVQLNMTESTLRQAYNLNPENFLQAPKYDIAHFVVTLSEADTAKHREGYRKIADKVRTRLADGEDPEKVFSEINDLDLGIFGSVYTTALDNRLMDRTVRDILMEMKPGQTSKIIEIRENIDGRAVPVAYHVIKLRNLTPLYGRTFEEARPMIERAAGELARQDVLALIRKAKSHRTIINLSGIPAHKIPTTAELRQQKPAISLKI